MSSALPIATNLYFDNHFQRPGVKLLPNEFYTTHEDMVLVTVLGSCVAACIQDRTAGIGGMNHFMLPDDGADVGAARVGFDALRRVRHGSADQRTDQGAAAGASASKPRCSAAARCWPA